ncbi:lytic transglycosylase domain-containing protein [Frankia sp. AgB32]|uniref:lytic transglycosylase domain-containing protein n=1 Tax=Frankia sp. AgB32 TaxID=631119 RepID=UPI00200C648B|nr:lytic transglycosylase domain-containing protein [Frankia sp. AgB32]MCK9895204.1 lytic transglycosylase domain-containing protein [Frankia sp. AgB32]
MSPLTISSGWPLVGLVAAAVVAWWLGRRLVVAALLVAVAAVAGLIPLTTGGPAGGPLAAGAPVPAALRPWIDRAGSQCPQVTPALLAAQLSQESGFDPNARSAVGAQGIAQFMPGTWADWAVDADGNGTASPWDAPDAIVAQGRFMCALAARYQGQTDLALAAYNCGPGPVDRAGAVPAIAETRHYVATITALVGTYTDPSHL